MVISLHITLLIPQATKLCIFEVRAGKDETGVVIHHFLLSAPPAEVQALKIPSPNHKICHARTLSSCHNSLHPVADLEQVFKGPCFKAMIVQWSCCLGPDSSQQVTGQNYVQQPSIKGLHGPTACEIQLSRACRPPMGSSD